MVVSWIPLVSLGLSLLALVAWGALAWKVSKIAAHHWNLTAYDKKLETHLDDFIDFRDKMRNWMKRIEMRQVRAAKVEANGHDSSEATPDSAQTVKASIRRRLREMEAE